MNASVTQTRKPFRQELRYYLPRWMAVVLAITLVQDFTTATLTEQSFWSLPGLVLIGLLEGAFGGLVFVGLQRWLNPNDSRPRRLRNYLVAIMVVGIGSWLTIAAIYR
ncbi:MAG TPA: hypothetical protein VIY68_06295 [Steroidobacteraceae bacterium]